MRCFSDCKVTGSPSSFHSRHVSKTVNIVHLKAWNDSRLSWGDLDIIGIVRVYALLVLSLSKDFGVKAQQADARLASIRACRITLAYEGLTCLSSL